jgi:hypothetical protein
VGSVQEAASDSTKPILLPTVVVSERRARPGRGNRPDHPGDAAWIPSSARFLYPDDGTKLLLGDLRISSPLPASADLRLYGLPVDQTAREYVWGHRIGGPMTSVLGSRTKVNPDVVGISLHPFLMPHRFRDTNGSVELSPGFHSPHVGALSLASDAVERRATLWMTAEPGGVSNPQLQVVSSFRQSDVVPLLEIAVPELRVVPRYLDSQTHARFRTGRHTVEGFLLLGHERGDWRETVDSVDAAVLEDTRQNLAILRYERLLPRGSRLTAGISWEGDDVDSEHRYGDFTGRTRSASQIVNPRIEYSMRRDALTAWV